MRTPHLNMINRIVAASVIVMLLPRPVAAADRHDWNNVRNLSAGTAIVVHSKAGQRWRGEFATATADSLTLTVDDAGSRRRVGLARSEVKEVRKKWPRVSSGLLGALIGASIGGGIGGGIEAK